MKYLYTTQPDEHCHKVAPGIWGRPTQTSEQAKLRAAGWVSNISELEVNDHVREEKEGRQEEVEVDSERVVLAAEYEKRFGKPPHHKMKAETIRKKLDYGMAQ